MTATILITNILLIWRVQFMEIGCQGARKWKKFGNQCAKVLHPTLLPTSPYKPAYKESRVTKTLCSLYHGETKQTCRNVCIWLLFGECNGWPVSPWMLQYRIFWSRQATIHRITTNGSTSYGLGNRQIVVRFTARARYSSILEVSGPGT